MQNFPNPFNPSTRIKYQISKPGLVTLKVYDMSGREVASLIHQNMGSGDHIAKFDGSKL